MSNELIPCTPKRILIVDDEKLIRDIFMQVVAFGLPECRIDLAVNGAEAVDTFRMAHHEVILMDLRMPVMDGETAFFKVEEMCEQENWEMPSVVFCTGYDISADAHKIVANSRKHYLLKKPVNNDNLLETLSNRMT